MYTLSNPWIYFEIGFLSVFIFVFSLMAIYFLIKRYVIKPKIKYLIIMSFCTIVSTLSLLSSIINFSAWYTDFI